MRLCARADQAPVLFSDQRKQRTITLVMLGKRSTLGPHAFYKASRLGCGVHRAAMARKKLTNRATEIQKKPPRLPSAASAPSLPGVPQGQSGFASRGG
jgi:hypothetical protein